MKTDLYTKAVLTVIAISLAGIAIQMTTKEAHAESGKFKFAPSGALVVTSCSGYEVTGNDDPKRRLIECSGGQRLYLKDMK